MVITNVYTKLVNLYDFRLFEYKFAIIFVIAVGLFDVVNIFFLNCCYFTSNTYRR